MTTNTEYTLFLSFVPGAQTMTDAISDALGELAGDYDIEAIATDLRAEIDAALPEGVTIHGNIGEVVGPYDERDQEIDYRGIWEGLDFWTIAAKHEITVYYQAAITSIDDDSVATTETITEAHAMDPTLSTAAEWGCTAADLECEPGTRLRVEVIRVDTRGSNQVIRTVEVVAS